MTARTRQNIVSAVRSVGIVAGTVTAVISFAWVNMAEPRIDRKIEQYGQKKMTPIEYQIEAIDNKLDVMMTDEQRERADMLLQIKRRERGTIFNP